MKWINLSIVLLLLFAGSGSLAQQAESPFTFNTTLTGDFVRNFAGGLRTGNGYAGRLNLSLQFNTEKAGWWKGGDLMLHGLNAHGGTPSSLYIGDIQPVSRIEASPRTILFEAWYRQKFGKFTALIGQHDMNSTFAVNRYSGMFLNTSMGIYPSTALNLPLSIYPVGAGCILLKWAPTDAFTLQTALYEGAPVRLEENPHNLKRDIQLDKRAFSTVEVQYHRIREGITKGSYKMGAFYHKGNLGDLSDSSRVHPGAGGLYFTADQLLWQETHGSAEGLGSFLQVGTTPGTQNLVNFYLNAGLHYQGLLSARPQDLLGIAFVYSSLNNAWVNGDPESRLPHRSLIELTYKARLGPHFSLQPDLQYIIHPGADAAISNSFIGMLRWSLHY